MRLCDFFPETYRLDVVADLIKFLNTKSDGFWLVKKAQSNQGKGIKLVADVAKFKEDLLTIKSDDEVDSTALLIAKLNKQMGINEDDS